MTQFDKYIGTVIDERYEIKELLGVGGMAIVFLAYDKTENCDIALKMLKEEVASDISARKCFESESRAISMLSHPNIREIYDISTSGEYTYLTMEYLDGPTLKSYIKEKGGISQGEAIDFVLQILSALDHTHSKGIVHRDIKPQNIIVTSDGSIKITDFGIAKLYDPRRSASDEKGVGTVYYISPEQASGKNIDARSDIYSLGIMLYEMVCHKLPFVADDPNEVAYMQVVSEPEKPSDIVELPKGLEQIIMKALAKNPDERFSDAGQMLAAVKRYKETPEAVFDLVSVPADSRFYDRAKKRNLDDLDMILAGAGATGALTVVPNKPGQKKNKNILLAIKRFFRRPKVRVETVKKKSSVSFISIVFGALLACLIVAVMTVSYVYNNFISESLSSGDAQILVIDDFVNRECTDELIANMEQLGYSVEIVMQPSAEHVINTIIKQSIEPGAKRPIIPGTKHCSITLYVCSGEDMVTLDNYIGQNYRDVKMILDTIGFPYEIIHENNSAIPEGSIIKTYPQAGSYITSDTLITLHVSLGQEVSYVSMPDLRNKTASDIRTLLAKNELLLTEVTYEYSSDVPAGQVISQFPYFGTMVPKHVTDVSVVVSMGVDPSTIPLPDPEPEPEPGPEDPENPDDPNGEVDPDTPNPNDPMNPDGPNPDESNPDDPIDPDSPDQNDPNDNPIITA
ncbi:MAG: PASTA domain-containing protein [Ruminococcaceae bacterium]|nr:PASTA domain-containing protein [Oscillospiraceae bacterium]